MKYLIIVGKDYGVDKFNVSSPVLNLTDMNPEELVNSWKSYDKIIIFKISKVVEKILNSFTDDVDLNNKASMTKNFNQL